MRAWWVCLPILVCLAGCSRGDEGMQQALDFRTELMASQGCGYTAAVTADLGEGVYQFAMDCDYSATDKVAHLTVVEPAEIAGIGATVSGDSAQLSFDDVCLEISTEVGGNIPPLVLPKVLGDGWVNGFIQWAVVEADGYTIQYALEQPADLWVKTKFDETMTPTYVEVYEGGYLVLSATITDWV